MVQNPIDYAKIYAGIADIMTVHAERISHEELSILKRKLKNKIGIALNPATSIEKTADFLDHSDMVLIMTVNPGFGGQKFLPETLEKIKALRKFYSGPIEVDGGINDATAKLAAAAGADILVAGTYVFKSMNYREAIEKLRRSV
jgi:ribulose-phosphate 3-epimerase